MKDSKYKVGDTITIKDLSKESSGSYRFGLNPDMRNMSGQSFKIKSCSFVSDSPGLGELPDDGYRYKLEGDSGNWSWASSMFKDPKPSFAQHVIEGDCSIDAFIKKNECPILDFTL